LPVSSRMIAVTASTRSVASFWYRRRTSKRRATGQEDHAGRAFRAARTAASTWATLDAPAQTTSAGRAGFRDARAAPRGAIHEPPIRSAGSCRSDACFTPCPSSLTTELSWPSTTAPLPALGLAPGLAAAVSVERRPKLPVGSSGSDSPSVVSPTAPPASMSRRSSVLPVTRTPPFSTDTFVYAARNSPSASSVLTRAACVTSSGSHTPRHVVRRVFLTSVMSRTRASRCGPPSNGSMWCLYSNPRFSSIRRAGRVSTPTCATWLSTSSGSSVR
jgi:hypothetical protein